MSAQKIKATPGYSYIINPEGEVVEVFNDTSPGFLLDKRPLKPRKGCGDIFLAIYGGGFIALVSSGEVTEGNGQKYPLHLLTPRQVTTFLTMLRSLEVFQTLS